MSTPEQQQKYSLIYEGVNDSQPRTLQVVKGVFIADLEFSAEQVANILNSAPIIIRTANDLEVLKPVFDKLSSAGANVSILQAEEKQEIANLEPEPTVEAKKSATPKEPWAPTDCQASESGLVLEAPAEPLSFDAVAEPAPDISASMNATQIMSAPSEQPQSEEPASEQPQSALFLDDEKTKVENPGAEFFLQLKSLKDSLKKDPPPAPVVEAPAEPIPETVDFVENEEVASDNAGAEFFLQFKALKESLNQPEPEMAFSTAPPAATTSQEPEPAPTGQVSLDGSLALDNTASSDKVKKPKILKPPKRKPSPIDEPSGKITIKAEEPEVEPEPEQELATEAPELSAEEPDEIVAEDDAQGMLPLAQQFKKTRSEEYADEQQAEQEPSSTSGSGLSNEGSSGILGGTREEPKVETFVDKCLSKIPIPLDILVPVAIGSFALVAFHAWRYYAEAAEQERRAIPITIKKSVPNSKSKVNEVINMLDDKKITVRVPKEQP